MGSKFEIFSKENLGSVRVCYDKTTGEAWFVAKDVCDCLGIKNNRGALSRLNVDEKMTVGLTDSHSGKRGGAQSIIVISESGLYMLIMGSRKKEAIDFQRWVTREVLPSIRKNGSYVMGQEDLPKEQQEAMSMAIAKLAKEVGAYKEDGNFWFEMYHKVLNDYAELVAALNGDTRKYTVKDAAPVSNVEGVWTDNQRFIIPNSVIAEGKYTINEEDSHR